MGVAPIKCFLVVPTFGELLKYADGERREHWSPDREIIEWTRQDTGERAEHLSTFPAGAMWYAYWMPPNWCWDNETEPHLIVRCPNPVNNDPNDLFVNTHDWDVDSRCSNCGSPQDRLHRCWIRHGAPPNVHVDKAGVTCKAGAGSIALPRWHGFLTNGVLQEQR